jgi:putative Ca2+/H+ antiporter (TMEM165/GDT1 family)
LVSPIPDFESFVVAFVTVSSTIFVAELTDKDALLILALATKTKPWTVFAAGSTAFTITTAIIVSIGYVLLSFVPVVWIKIAGGTVMIGYALWQYFFQKDEEREIEREEQRLLKTGIASSSESNLEVNHGLATSPDTQAVGKQGRRGKKMAKRSRWSIFLGAVLLLVLLDLAGDATEVLTIVFVARYENLLLVFFGCVLALVSASAVETAIGNRLGKFLSIKRLKILSLAVFLIIGVLVLLGSLFPSAVPFF